MNDDPAGARDFLDVLATTRAIRRFQDEEIPDEDLARLFHAASRAPSASNRQNFRFLVLRRGRDDRVRGILGGEYRRSWAEKSQRDGYTAAAAKSTGSRAARMPTAMEQFVDRFEQIPIV